MGSPQPFSDAEQGILERLRQFERGSPYRLHPQEDIVATIVQELAERERDYGLPYCPCRVLTGLPDQDRDAVCPCAALPDQIALYGHCDCGLFVSASRQDAD